MKKIAITDIVKEIKDKILKQNNGKGFTRTKRNTKERERQKEGYQYGKCRIQEEESLALPPPTENLSFGYLPKRYIPITIYLI